MTIRKKSDKSAVFLYKEYLYIIIYNYMVIMKNSGPHVTY